MVLWLEPIQEAKEAFYWQAKNSTYKITWRQLWSSKLSAVGRWDCAIIFTPEGQSVNAFSTDPLFLVSVEGSVPAGEFWLPEIRNVQNGGRNICGKFCSIMLINLCVSVWGLGDPHITTLDGANYTFNGWGEYILMRVEGFTLQGRTTPVNRTIMGSATQFASFAFGVPNVTVEV